jgi:outer membrane protein OmpA-like peptidoglycan-associated protein/uncharacterized protein YidB (DUF937 family)
MSSIETLVTEVARATGLGPNARKFIGVVIEYVFKQPGGLAGLADRFSAAGLGDIFTSWLSGQPNMRSVDAGQIRSALGGQSIEDIASKAGVSPSVAPTLLATALPPIIRAVTSGGVMPTALPAAFTGLLSAKGKKTSPYRSWRWLLPLLALLALAWCGWHSRNVAKAPPVAAPSANVAAVSKEPTLSFKNTDGKVTLNGTLGTVADKAKLLGDAVAAYGQDHVSADIKVDTGVKQPSWLKSVSVLFPALRQSGLQFALNGDSLKLDTSKLPEPERVAVSQLFQKELGNLEVEGLFDKGAAALGALPPGFSSEDLTQALNQTTITFETGSAVITRSSESILDGAAKAIQAAPAGLRVEVEGHTDNQGNAETNQKLSEERARSVVAALEARNVPADRLLARGFGANRPVGDNSTEEGRAANRRIAYRAL